MAFAVAILGAALLTVGVIDYSVHWPRAARAAILAAGIFAAFKLFQRWLRPVWRQTPSETSVAIRIEEVEPALRGLLASAVDFESGGTSKQEPLAAEVVERASSAWKTLQPGKHIRRMPAVGAAAVAWLMIGMWIWGFLAAPQIASIALTRTLLPWSSAEWPPRMLIRAEIPMTHVAKGETILMRARPGEGEGHKSIEGMRVDAVCEIKDASGTVTTKTFEMVAQSDGSWERPLVAEGETITISFATDDTRTAPVEIKVVEPPTVRGAELVVAPPAYAAPMRERVEVKWEGGAMPALPAVLAGSTATLRMNFSIPSVAKLDAEGRADPAWLARTVAAIDMATSAAIETIQFSAPSPTQWALTWPLDASVDIVVDPSDENGIRGPQPLRARIQVVPDQEPTVVVADPEQDEVVTRMASLPTRIEAKDDLGLASIGFRLDRQQRSGEPAPKLMASQETPVASREGEFKSTLELASLEVKSGDTLFLRGTALDLYERDGQKRKPAASEPRRIRVVEQDVFEQNIRQQTSALRQAAARLEMAQKDAIDEKDVGNAIQSQKSLSDRIDQAQKTAERLSKRLGRNGMKDSNIAEALREVDQQGAAASTHSQNASQQLRQGADGKAEAIKEAKDEQNQALKAIQSMLEILDRDDDAAGAQRRTDRLAESISKLRKEMQQTAQRTAGRTAEELSAEDQSQLRGEAQKQRAAAQEARALIEDLQDRAERTQKKDQIQAQSLRGAAAEGERGDAAKHMEEAADRSERNQAGAADDSMQAAAEAVAKIQKALKADRQAKNEELKRRLSSLVETIRALVAQAEAGRSAIDAIVESAPQTQDDAGKKAEQLSRNTSAATEESKGGGRAAEPVTKVLERAAVLEGEVVVALRATPMQIDPAKDASSRGLELLKEALAKAEEAKQKQEADDSEKEREDLAKKYAEFARIEGLLRQEVAAILPPDQKKLDRRAAATSREMAERQETLRGQVAGVPKESATVKEAAVFLKTHELIDEWMKSTRDEMAQTTPTPGTVAMLDLTTEALQSLAAALADPEPKDDPFAQNNGGRGDEGAGEAGGGAGEQKKKIPPLAELRLVRELQAQINRRTKTIDEVGADSPAASKAIDDLSKLQNDVRSLGEDWVERMKKASAPTKGPKSAKPPEKAPPPTEGSASSLLHGFGIDPPASDPQNPTPQVPPAQQEAPKNSDAPAPPDAAKSQDAPAKTLDELLGIGGKGGERAAEAQRKEQLERGLKEESLDDLAEAAMKDMRLAQELVSKERDLGIGTQRVQAQALSRLDALIDAAVKFEKSNKSKPSKKQSQKSQSDASNQSAGDPKSEAGEDAAKPKPGEGTGQKNQDGRRNENGQSGDEVNPPDFQDADMQADSAMDEGRSEWGRLPQRIREIMSQSRRDRVSTLYQRATEAYYRRMAEDRGP
ncbi:MAG: hypothetical protein K8R92_07415 [Planctomycetes bacterium]|nr:hypothetical protein [Planctomycetota bacterium]